MAGFGFNIGLDGRNAEPLTDRDAEEIAGALAETYSQARETMLRNVSSRLGRGVTGYGWAERKASEVLDAHRQLEKIYDRAAKQRESLLQGVIDRAMLTGNQKFYSDMGSILGNVAHISPNAAKAGYILADLNNALDAAHRRILRQFDDRYADVIATASAKMATGVTTAKQAVGEALTAFADNGVDCFIDRGGHHWTMENYSEMAVLTAIERSTIAGYVDTMQSYDYDLAIIDGHAGSCPICAAWEGVIVSVSGDNPDYPSLGDAENDGCFHPRCLHGITTYYPGVTHEPKDGFRNEPREIEDPGPSYTTRSKQRYMERQIRKYKDRAIVAQTTHQKLEAKRKLREWENALDQLIEDQPDDNYMYRQRGREISRLSQRFDDVTEKYIADAKPGTGNITYDPGYEHSKRHANEERFAQWLHSHLGGDIRLRQESDIEGVKTSDYIWRGKYWDLKNTTTSKAAKSAIKKGLEQIASNPGGIILDYGKNSFNLEEVLKYADSRMSMNKFPFESDLMIIKDEDLLKVYHYKK